MVVAVFVISVVVVVRHVCSLVEFVDRQATC